MPRFFVDLPLQGLSQLRLPSAVAHHAQRVLRLREGERIVLFDGRGGEYEAILALTDAGAWATALSFQPTERESPLQITLIQALVAADKLDWIVEKATELGVHAIVLSPCERSVARLAGDRAERRLAHLLDVATAACAQCGRNRRPSIRLATSLEAALADTAATARFILAPGSAAPLRPTADAIAVAVGPEGGFSETELARAERAGYTRALLGPRTLRTETAGLAALAALQATAGDLRLSLG